MHVDTDTSSPEPVSAPAESSTPATGEDVDIVNRLNTESPRPGSRSGGVFRPVSEHIDIDGPSRSTNKPMETDHDVTLRDDRHKLHNASDRSSSAFDMTSPVSADSDKTEDVALSSHNRVQDDYYLPSVGYEFSNVRVRQQHIL
jgi:hypothetical protein